jgi:hypothetical protein
MKRVFCKCVLPVLSLAVICGCTPQGGGGGNPTGGGQGIPEGTVRGTLQCTETTTAVQQGSGDTVLSQTTPSFPVTYSFGDNGIVLDGNGDPLAVGSVGSTTITDATATATIRSVTTSVDRLDVIADATATVNVPQRGQRVMLGVVTAVYTFAEPDMVTVNTVKNFQSNVIDGEFIQIVASCSGSLPYLP